MHKLPPFKIGDTYSSEDRGYASDLEQVIAMVHTTFPTSKKKVTEELCTFTVVEDLTVTGYNSKLTITWKIPDGEFTSKELSYNRIDISDLSLTIDVTSEASDAFNALDLPYDELWFIVEAELEGQMPISALPTSFLYKGSSSITVNQV